MKLLEITRSFYPSVGGLEKFVNDRLKIYESLGIDCTILSTTFMNKKRDYSLRNGKTIFLKQYTPFNYTPDIKNHLKSGYDFISINQTGRYFSDRAIYHYAKLGKKILLTPHFTYHTSRYRSIKKIHDLIITGWLLKKCTAIICFTEHERKYWLDTYKLPPEKLIVIPHYLDPDYEYRPNPVTGEKYLLYLGRAAENKKTDLLIRAFHLLNQNNYKLKLSLDYEDLEEDTKKIAAADDRIELLGYIPESEKDKIIADCSALVYPSEYEAFGHLLLEASKFSKPLICSNLDVFKEILDPLGVLFFDNSVEGITKKLSEFFNLDDEIKSKMGDVNYERLKRFSFKAVQKKYSDLFSSLAL